MFNLRRYTKVSYLTKIITCVGIALGTSVPARPLKVVAGLEPENTNTFLQMLAAAATVGPARYCSPRHRMPFNSTDKGSNRVEGPGGFRSPRHRLPFNSRNEGSTCVG